MTGLSLAGGPRKVAVAGAGVIGTHHAHVVGSLAGRAELTAVADADGSRAARLAAGHGAQPFPSLAAALTGAEIDIVAVCTPTGTHGELALEALAAGKHVVIEKPAEISPERTDEIIAAARAAGTHVTVISQHRFDPATRTVLAAIRRGDLGRLTSGIAAIDWWRGQDYYDSGGWRGTWDLDCGGALMNQGVHTVDLLLAAFGPAEEVFAYTATLAHQRIEVEDVAVGAVRFRSGALGVLHATTSAYPGLSARLHVHGDRGSAVIEDDRLRFLRTDAGDAAPASPGGPVRTASADPGDLSDAHRLQYLNLLDALDGTGAVEVTLETNRRAIALITAVYESARTGAPVRVPD